MSSPPYNSEHPVYEPYDRGALRLLCWGLLLHMDGLREDSGKCFEELDHLQAGVGSNGGSLQKIAASVSSYSQASGSAERSEAHRQVVWALDRVINPDGHEINGGEKEELRRARLSLESGRGEGNRQAKDGPWNGYSRDPFKRIYENHMPEIALAAVAYLMRAHSFFFYRPREERSFNAAKVSLNDLFQVTQLTFRLYYSLDECHHERVGSRTDYVQAVRQGPDLAASPWTSPYFVWTALHLVEIQRGNIYRQLQYSEEADRYYRHAQQRYMRLGVDPFAVGAELQGQAAERDSSNCRWFITPTLVRTLAERSKVLFNRGLFIDSMMCQIHSLALLAWRGSQDSSGSGLATIFSDISRGLAYLEVVRNESVWDKNKIHELFFANDEEKAPFLHLRKSDFREPLLTLDPEDLNLAADCYARIALTLFILLTRSKAASLPTYYPSIGSGDSEVDQALEQRLGDLVEMASVYQLLKVDSPSAIVRDALMILRASGKETSPGEGTESLDRSLTRRLGDSIRDGDEESSHDPPEEPRDRRQFFKAVLEIATQHILNIVTIPRRIQNFLIRPGYKERRKSGDLSGRTVAESVGPDPAQRDETDPDPDARTTPSPPDPQESQPAVDGTDRHGGKLTDKFVVLRRWQSFNPKIPRPHSHAIRGGGYFLMWGGKGVVIDPGYDFLQNFYDEGFSIADIDAVVVTHSHPDHEDDLSTLSTLVREWNEYHQHMGRKEPPLTLDLLLNESAHLKFSNWLKASDFGIGRIIPLPLVVWNLDSTDPGEEIRGGNVTLRLRDKYKFDLEVVPAWHDDVIGKTAAVGLKFHLFTEVGGEQGVENVNEEDEKKGKVGILGYTSDTGAYPWTEPAQKGADLAEEIRPTKARHNKENLRVEEQYGDCDVLVVHLGDVRLRELFSLIDPPGEDPRMGVSIGKFLSTTFCAKDEDHVDPQKATKERVGEFFKLLITLHLAPQRALGAILDPSCEPPLTVANALHTFSREGKFSADALKGFATYRQARRTLENLTADHDRVQITDYAQKHLSEAVPADVQWRTALDDWQVAYTLLGFLCAASASRWHYGYHLGITGLYRMQRALLSNFRHHKKRGEPARERVLVIGELPEELASYRHQVTRLLNFTEGNFDLERPGRPNRLVHAFTGDIGLHIGLGTENGEDTKETQGDPSPKGSNRDDEGSDSGTTHLVPTIRCTYCNYNNETVLKPGNYHPPEKIFETPLKRLDSAMIYLCTEHDHHPEAERRPPDFLSRPSLRVI